MLTSAHLVSLWGVAGGTKERWPMVMSVRMERWRGTMPLMGSTDNDK